MKEQKNRRKTGFIKKIFIKFCRILGYEIIDQNTFYVPTQRKNLNENLHIQGKKSITIPLGEIKVTRKVRSLTIILRSCTSINMLTQNKKRLYEKDKSEYTFRSLNSIISSLKNAMNIFPQIKFNIIVVDHNSKKEDLDKMKNIINKLSLSYSITSLNLEEFKNKINKINAKKQNVTDNQFSNMANIYKSLEIAKSDKNDLIYFVEDDYIHTVEAISEMIFTYERISSQLNSELILCPTDYPYLYTKLDPTNIFIGSSRHWRVVNETLCTFLTSKNILSKYWDRFISMCEYEHYPFEKPLHEIYQSEYCLSPIPSLAVHFTNVNSIFGLSPNTDWKKLWDENEKY